MAIHRIAFSTEDPHFIQQTQLDGVFFGFRVYWNEREAAWYFDLLDSSNNPITLGRKIVAKYPLLHRCIDERRPAGELYVIDLSNTGIDPGLNELDKRIVIVYYDADEMGRS
jgi:hypothetical protein